MNRREAIKSSAFLAGCGLSAGTIAAILGGCKPEATATPTIDLSDDLINMLSEIVETIIPTTDTPGAKEAQVHTWMAQSVKDNFSLEEQQMFQAALEGIADAGFMDMNNEEREKFLVEMQPAEEDGPNPFEVLKSMTCYGYFTSEIGATQALAFDPIPGEWRGCIDFDEVGKSWAL